MKNSPQSTRSAEMGHILLATRNGGSYLGEQLASLEAQTNQNWVLSARDDNSEDDTAEILRQFQKQNPARVGLRVGARLGATQNFLTLLAKVPEDAPWIAFCDQDDVWLSSKLSDGSRWLAEQGQAPALYVSRSVARDATLDKKLLAPHRKNAGFSNALVENIAPGHAVMLNRAALWILKEGLAFAWNVFAHDWWAYALISAAGGRIHLDDKPGQIHRQHANHVLGYRNKLRALSSFSNGQYVAQRTTIIDAIAPMRPYFTAENQLRFDRFRQTHQARSAYKRIAGISAAGLHRCTKLDQLALYFHAAVRCG